MDINYYLAREQVELAFARAALSPAARAAHQQLAQRYRAMVEDHRSAVGASGFLPRRVSPPGIPAG